jgi:hypothetical protein
MITRIGITRANDNPIPPGALRSPAEQWLDVGACAAAVSRGGGKLVQAGALIGRIRDAGQ